MTRKQVLALLVLHARNHGFLFRRWYKSHIQTPWQNFEAAIDLLIEDQRYYALLFSHDFAQSFWKHGSQITFVVPTVEYKRPSTGGKIITVRRKAFTRRTTKPDAWLYHLREMAASEDPLRYIRRFLVTREEIEAWNTPQQGAPKARSAPIDKPAGPRAPSTKPRSSQKRQELYD